MKEQNLDHYHVGKLLCTNDNKKIYGTAFVIK
jgi:hypothetical protein